MQAFFFANLVAAGCLILATGDEPTGKLKDSAADATFRELAAALPKSGARAKSARLEVEYWHDHPNTGFLGPPVRHAVRTKDGKAAEIVFIRVPANSMPGSASANATTS